MRKLDFDTHIRVKLTREGEHYMATAWSNRQMIVQDAASLANAPTGMQTAMDMLKTQHVRMENIKQPVNGMIDMTLNQFLLIFGPKVDRSTYRGDNDLTRMVEQWILIGEHDLLEVNDIGATNMVRIDVDEAEAAELVNYMYELEDEGVSTSRLREIFEDALEEYANIN